MFPVDFLLVVASNVQKRNPGDLQASTLKSPTGSPPYLKLYKFKYEQGDHPQVGRSSMREYLNDVVDVTFPRIKNAIPNKKCRKLQNGGRLKMHSNCQCKIIFDFIQPYI